MKSRFLSALTGVALVGLSVVPIGSAFAAPVPTGPKPTAPIGAVTPPESNSPLLGYLDSMTVPDGVMVDGVPFGGISGLDYDPATNSYLALSDDRSETGPARYYDIQLPLDGARFAAAGMNVVSQTVLKDPSGKEFAKKAVDPEAVRYNAARDKVVWASEGASSSGDPAFIREMSRAGVHEREIALPKSFAPVLDGGKLTAGVRNNQSLESLTFNPSGTRLTTVSENALVQDGPQASQTETSPSRLAIFDYQSGKIIDEYVYQVDKTISSPTAPLPPPVNVLASDRGASEILALNDTDYLVVERSFASGVGFQIRVYWTTIRGAEPVTGAKALSDTAKPMVKKLLFDFNGDTVDADNVETITWGPTLPDGSRSIIIGSDDNFGFNDSKTRFHLLSVNPVLLDTTIQIVGINDFHGRIAEAGVALAGSVMEATEANPATAFMSAGDNVGASTYVSSSQQDNPTIDVLNAIGLKTSAVGNHEFDAGFDDLKNRISTRSDFPILGANVRYADTGAPALPEYSMIDVGGVKLGVIGVVTQETPTLTGKSGTKGLVFTDLTESVNRIAGQLTDGNPANDEADLLIVLTHDGATEGQTTTTLPEEIALGTSFAQMVTQADPKVAAILTGHTHKNYVWDGPIPGSAKTRPVIQTGSYGEFLATVQLTYNPITKQVSSYQAENVAMTKTPATELIAKSPMVAKVNQIINTAKEAAAELGQRPVGSITADIKRAQTPDGAEDRSSESQLVNLVADSMLEGIANGPYPADVGLMIPGSVRGDLSFRASGDESDGVVTYEEASNVLPWESSLVRVSVTGAELVEILEHQWQPAGSKRPLLHLGVAGMTFRYDSSVALPDPADPRSASRITEVLIAGKPVDKDARYTVVTNKFLAQGGDNFDSFSKSKDLVDTGLLDTDTLATYLGAHAPVAPMRNERAVDEVDDVRKSLTTTPIAVTGAQSEEVALKTMVTAPQDVAGPLTLGSGQAPRSAPKFEVTPGSIDQLNAGTATALEARVKIPSDLGAGEHVVRLAITTEKFDHNPLPGGYELSATVTVRAGTAPTGPGDPGAKTGQKVDGLPVTGASVIAVGALAAALLGAGIIVLRARKAAALKDN